MAELKKLKRAVIKEELVAITGDMMEAIILNQFLYWSERVSDFDQFVKEENERQLKYSRPSQGEEPQEQPLLHGWIYKKASELMDEIMSSDSERTINRKIDNLIEKGFLDRRNNPKIKYDRTYQYRINFPNLVMALVQHGYTLEGYKLDLSMYFKPLETHNRQNDACKSQGDAIKSQYDALKCQYDALKQQFDALKQQNGGAIPEITLDTTLNTTLESTDREESPTPSPILPILERLKSSLTDISFNTWIKPTVGNAYLDSDTIVIPCKNDFTKEIIESRYIDLIKPMSKYPLRVVLRS